MSSIELGSRSDERILGGAIGRTLAVHPGTAGLRGEDRDDLAREIMFAIFDAFTPGGWREPADEDPA